MDREFLQYLQAQGYTDADGNLRDDLSEERQAAALEVIGFNRWLQTATPAELDTLEASIFSWQAGKFLTALEDADTFGEVIDLS
jgi:hypothetical protein